MMISEANIVFIVIKGFLNLRCPMKCFLPHLSESGVNECAYLGNINQFANNNKETAHIPEVMLWFLQWNCR